MAEEKNRINYIQRDRIMKKIRNKEGLDFLDLRDVEMALTMLCIFDDMLDDALDLSEHNRELFSLSTREKDCFLERQRLAKENAGRVEDESK